VLGVLFAPYNEEDGREYTYYKRRAIGEEDDGGDGKDHDGPSSRLCLSISRTTSIAWEDRTVASVQIEG
jgi:hypothetical protein